MIGETEYCKHGFPMFQTCHKCGRNMMKEADEAFKKWCKTVFNKKYVMPRLRRITKQ